MSVRHAFLAMLSARPMYGYELKSTYDKLLVVGNALNLGQIYTTLARLERDGLVEPAGAAEGDEKKYYRITGKGKAELSAWLGESGGWETYTDSLSYKLAVREYLDPLALRESIAETRRQLLINLQALTHSLRRLPEPGAGAAMVIERNLFRLEADIKWLDNCLRTIKREGDAHD